jgi:hypothetical protein
MPANPQKSADNSHSHTAVKNSGKFRAQRPWSISGDYFHRTVWEDGARPDQSWAAFQSEHAETSPADAEAMAAAQEEKRQAAEVISTGRQRQRRRRKSATVTDLAARRGAA